MRLENILFAVILVHSAIVHAEGRCKKKNVSPIELRKINGCLDRVSSAIHFADVHLHADTSGNFYATKTENDTITVYTEAGNFKSGTNRLSCATDRTSKLPDLFSSLIEEHYKKFPKDGSVAWERLFREMYSECQVMTLDPLCGSDNSAKEKQPLQKEKGSSADSTPSGNR